MGTSRSISPSDASDFLTVRGDIAEVETAQMIVEQAVNRFGRIDSLINNAGIFISKPFTDYTLDDYLAITAVNLTGFFHITQGVIRQMLAQGTGGHIVNITTSLVDHPESKNPSALVSLTKGGLAAVTRSLAIEYASRGLRFNAVALGVIENPVYDPASYRGPGSAPSAGPSWPDQRRCRGNPLSRAGLIRHGCCPAHRWWSVRGGLIRQLMAWQPVASALLACRRARR